MIRLSSLTVHLLLPALTYGAPVTGLDALRDNVSHSMELLKGNLGQFEALPCLRPDSASHIQGFASVANSSAHKFVKGNRDFMAMIQKPIEGNGKCEGGFSAVARGAAERSMKSYVHNVETWGAQMEFAAAFDEHVNTVQLDVSDDSEEGECEFASIEMYKAIQQNGNLVNSSFTAYRGGVETVMQGFDAYTARNTGLKNDCGSVGEGMVSFDSILRNIQAQPVSQGNSPVPSSTVTGKIRNDTLEGPEATATLGRTAMTESTIGNVASPESGPESAPSSVTGRSTKSEREQILGSVTRNVAIVNDTGARQSEEAAVASLLTAGKQIALGARTDASGDSLNPLEAMVFAQNNAGPLPGKENLSAPPEGNDATGSSPGRPKNPDLSGSRGTASILGSGTFFGSPDQALFERMHLILRQQKRELEKRKRVPQDH